MPLMHGKSSKAFSKNVAAEMHAGKPLKQSLAIAYATKRKAMKHKAMGGEIDGSSDHEFEITPMPEHEGTPKESYSDIPLKKPQVDAQGNPIRTTMAHGGFVEEELESGYIDHEGNFVKHNPEAMAEDDRMLNQHGEEEEGPEDGMAHGGFIGSHQDMEHEMDMVGRVMAQKQRHYSMGGRVANMDSGESASSPQRMAKDKDNEFDDLALRDDLAFDYTGANSGDEAGDKPEDERRRDIVGRVRRSWGKKDRNPSPA